MSNLADVFKAHQKKRAVAAPSEVKSRPVKTTSKPKKTANKKGWKKSNTDPQINSKKTVSNTPLDGLDILILDTAADSLNPRQANLFQVSMLSGNFNSGHWKENAYRIETVNMPAHFILSLEGEDDLFPDKRRVDAGEALSNVIDAIEKADLVIAYSASYHLQLIACEASRAGFEMPKVHVLDPFTVYSAAYKYSRGKKLVDAIEKYGSKISNFGTPGFYARIPLAIKWLVENMIQDENCALFFDQGSVGDLVREQVISSAMNYVDLKEFFAKQANGRTVTWRPWPSAPDGSNKVPEGLLEIVPELGGEFVTEPDERPVAKPISFAYFKSNALFQTLAIGLLSTEETAEAVKIGDCSLTAFLKNDSLECVLAGITSDAMYSAISEMNKFPLTAIGVEDQIFEPLSTSTEDDGTLIMRLVLSQK